jgi:hypothetical protein
MFGGYGNDEKSRSFISPCTPYALNDDAKNPPIPEVYARVVNTRLPGEELKLPADSMYTLEEGELTGDPRKSVAYVTGEEAASTGAVVRLTTYAKTAAQAAANSPRRSILRVPS